MGQGPAMSVEVNKKYHSALLAALGAALLAGLIDCGVEVWPASMAAYAVFWGFVFVVVCRRPRNPTPVDLALIRWGLLPFIIVFDALMYMVWHLRGVLR
jgi:hypothetical protein